MASQRDYHLTVTRVPGVVLFLRLLLCGDVELNPGPIGGA